MAGDHSAAFLSAKAALGEFAETLTEEQRTTLNRLLAKFVTHAVLDYRTKRDRAEAALAAARKAADPTAGLRDALFGPRNPWAR